MQITRVVLELEATPSCNKLDNRTQIMPMLQQTLAVPDTTHKRACASLQVVK
jgi:hypothetical protein